MRLADRRLFAAAAVAALVAGASSCASPAPATIRDGQALFTRTVDLPEPTTGDRSLETVLGKRRSVREFASEELSLAEIGQLFWAAQGITNPDGKRTAPSAGGLYPLEVYALTDDAVLHYLPAGHRAEVRGARPWRAAMRDAALGQDVVAAAPAMMVITARGAVTAQKYGRLADDFVQREAGHAAQNLLLEATAINLAAVPVGGIDAAAVATILALPPGETVIYLVPVGHPTA